MISMSALYMLSCLWGIVTNISVAPRQAPNNPLRHSLTGPTISSPPSDTMSISPRMNTIQCLRPAETRTKISIAGCRATLNELREFPHYRKLQAFEKGLTPKVPTPPPFEIRYPGTSCVLFVTSLGSSIIDVFSFEQIRAAALDVIEECDNSGANYGGIAPLGRGIGWTVCIYGAGETLSLPSWNGSTAIIGNLTNPTKPDLQIL